MLKKRKEIEARILRALQEKEDEEFSHRADVIWRPRGLERAGLLHAIGGDEVDVRVFDSVRSAMQREGKICFDWSDLWTLAGWRTRVEEKRQAYARYQNWKQARRELMRKAGEAACTSAAWPADAGKYRELYKLLSTWSPEEFAERGMPCDLALLAWVGAEEA